MKRVLVAVAGLVAALAVPVLAAPSAGAACIPDGPQYIYKITNKDLVLHPTNVYSDWVWPKNGSWTISYSETKTASVSASVTATVSAEAGIIFAKASTSIGVTVGGQWSKSKTWTYSATVAKDPDHLYRVHLYRSSYNFTVTKKLWSNAQCDYTITATGWPQQVGHAPVTGSDPQFNTWTTDRKAA